MEKARQTISLVIPCHAVDLICMEWVIRSVNYQTYLPAEVIVAISGCNKPTAVVYELVWRKILDPSVRLHLLIHEAQLAAGTNRQLGAEIAKGEIISWFDADDLQLPDRLNQIEMAFQNQHILGVYHRFLWNSNRRMVPADRQDFLYRCGTGMYHRGWASVRKDVVNKVVWTKRKRGQDFVYQRMLLEEFGPDAIALLPVFLGRYFHFNHLTEGREAQKLREITDCYHEVLAELHAPVKPQY